MLSAVCGADLDAVKSSAIDGGVVPSPHMVLPGHRSIANQIRYSPTHHLLCSSGVEKIIKASLGPGIHCPNASCANADYH